MSGEPIIDLACGIQAGYGAARTAAGQLTDYGTVGMLRLLNRPPMNPLVYALTGGLNLEIPLIMAIGIDRHAAAHIAGWAAGVPESPACRVEQDIMLIIATFAELAQVSPPDAGDLALIGRMVLEHLPQHLQGRIGGYVAQYHSNN